MHEMLMLMPTPTVSDVSIVIVVICSAELFGRSTTPNKVYEQYGVSLLFLR